VCSKLFGRAYGCNIGDIPTTGFPFRVTAGLQNSYLCTANRETKISSFSVQKSGAETSACGRTVSVQVCAPLCHKELRWDPRQFLHHRISVDAPPEDHRAGTLRGRFGDQRAPERMSTLRTSDQGPRRCQRRAVDARRPRLCWCPTAKSSPPTILICSPKTRPFRIGNFRGIFPWLEGAEDDEGITVLERAEGVQVFGPLTAHPRIFREAPILRGRISRRIS